MQLQKYIDRQDELFTTTEPVSEGRVSEIHPLLLYRGDITSLLEILDLYPGLNYEHPLNRGRKPIMTLVHIKDGKRKVATYRDVGGLWYEQVTQVQKVVYDYPSMRAAIHLMSYNQMNRLNPSTSMRFGMALVGFILGLDAPVIRKELTRFISLLMLFSDRIRIEGKQIIINAE